MPHYWPGLIDELRVSARLLPSGHLAMHRINEGDPTRFYGHGAVDSAAVGALSPVALPLEFVVPVSTTTLLDPAARNPGGPGTLTAITAPSLGTANISGGRISVRSTVGGTATLNYTLTGPTGKTSTAPIRISYTGDTSSTFANGYEVQYGITLPIQSSTGGTAANFLLPFAISHPDLRTVANGGTVRNANGWDIRFETSAATPARLHHKLLRYDGVTGVIVALVNLPRTFSAAELIYMYTGNAEITAPEENPTLARAGGWLAWYYGAVVTDQTGLGRNLTSNNATATTLGLWGAGDYNGTSSVGQGNGVATWANALPAISVVSYHQADSTALKHELFSMANGAAANLSIHMNETADNRLSFTARFGTTVNLYQSANNRQVTTPQAVAAVASAGQAMKMAINGAMETPSLAPTPAGTTSVTNALQIGARPGTSDLARWDGRIAFLGFCARQLSNSEIMNMTAAFTNPTSVYTVAIPGARPPPA